MPAQEVAVCHEVTEAVVQRAIARGIDLIVTYHPLLFRPTNRLVAERSPSGRAFRLITAGVALSVAHTAFDIAGGGTADSLAAAAGLTRVRRFGPVQSAGQVKIVTFVPEDRVEEVADAMTKAGAGRIGNYSGCSYRTAGTGAFHPDAGADPVTGTAGEANREPETRIEMIAPASARDRVCAALVTTHPYEEPAFDVYEVASNLGFIGRVGDLRDPIRLDELARSLVAATGGRGTRVSGDPDAVVRTVAVIPGSGGSFVASARAAGADVLVTGDVAHHTVVQALDAGMAVVDLGHTTSERPGMASLAALVARLAEETGSRFHDMTDIDPTPWR